MSTDILNHASFYHPRKKRKKLNKKITQHTNTNWTDAIRKKFSGSVEKLAINAAPINNESRLADIRQRKEQQRTERTNSVIADGFLYFLESPAYPGWIKVGQTSDYEKRLATYQTASPHADYNMIHVSYVEDRVHAEQAMFVALSHLPRKGEWFEVRDLDINNFGLAGHK
jgi:hypothetical protein